VEGSDREVTQSFGKMGPQPSRMTEKTVLLIINPQVDFLPTGNFPIPGSEEDSERIKDLIMNHCDEIDEIYVSTGISTH